MIPPQRTSRPRPTRAVCRTAIPLVCLTLSSLFIATMNLLGSMEIVHVDRILEDPNMLIESPILLRPQPLVAAPAEESIRSANDGNITITIFINEKPHNKRWFLSFFQTDQLSLYGRYHYKYEYLYFRADPDRLRHKARASQYCVLVALSDQVIHFQKKYAPHCYTIAVNDEFCNGTEPDAISEIQGRFYYNQHAAAPLSNQTFIPLGPRLDFWKAFKKQKTQRILPTSQRSYLFNAIFTQETSPSRTVLADYLASHKNLSSNSIINVAPTWNRDMNPSETIHPTDYVKILSQSQFTLSPSGHNPECFRLYEAATLGSIPVVAFDHEYQTHSCPHAFQPLHMQQGDGELPFVILENWTMLESTLDRLFFREPHGRPSSQQSVARRLDAFQSRLLRWYHPLMRRYVRLLEDQIVEHAHCCHRVKVTPYDSDDYETYKLQKRKMKQQRKSKKS